MVSVDAWTVPMRTSQIGDLVAFARIWYLGDTGPAQTSVTGSRVR